MKKPSQKPIVRHDNWPRLLHDFIEERRGRPFVWGEHDCCLFACDGIQAITGLDPAAKLYRGKYRDALGAARLLKRQGGVEAVAEKVCARHGFAEVPLPFAHRGDVVLVDQEMRGATMGVCLGAIAAFISDSGMVFVPTLNCRRAWAVGRQPGGPT